MSSCEPRSRPPETAEVDRRQHDHPDPVIHWEIRGTGRTPSLSIAAHSDGAKASPRLTIAMPTQDRSELLERALGSVLRATASVGEQVEITVSDRSADDSSAEVVRRLLAGWPRGYRYVSNRPALSLPGNLNRAVGLASGERILQLHDDYLLPDAGPMILETTRRTPLVSGACCSVC